MLMDRIAGVKLRSFKKICLIAIFSWIALLCGCKSGVNEQVVRNPSFDLIQIPLPGNVTSSLVRPSLLNTNGEEYLAAYDYQNHKIVIFNLTKRAYVSSIVLQEDGPDFLESVESIAFIDTDTLILAGLNHVSMINRNGHVLKRIGINNAAKGAMKELLAELELFVNQYSGLQYDAEDQTVLFGVNSLIREKPQTYLGSRLAELSLEGKLSFLPVQIPQEFAQLEGDYGELTRIGFTRMDNKLIYNFPLSSKVFTLSGDNQRAVDMRSGYTDNEAEPITDFSEGFNLARVKHQMKAASFYPIICDNYRKLFYRVHNGAIDNINDSPEAYLIVADSGFNKVMEIPFPDSYYIFPIISREGLMFSAISKHDDKLELIRYRFS